MGDYQDDFDGPGRFSRGWVPWAIAAACVAVPVILALWAVSH